MKLHHLFSGLLLALCIVSCNKEESSIVTEKTYNNIVCNKVILTSDSKFLLVGSSYSDEFGRDLLIVKFDENFDKIWEYKHNKAFNQFGESLVETDDGFIAVGANSKDGSDSLNLYVIKISKQGELIWSKSYFEAYPYSHGYDIVSAYDEGFIISGNIRDPETSSFDNSYTLILKINEDGDSLNSKVYIGGNDNGHSIIKFNDNYFISSSRAIFIANDNLIAVYAIVLEKETAMTKLHILNNNAYLAYGYTKSNTSFLMKYDHKYELIWSREYEDITILSIAEHKSNFFATGKVKDEYFDKLLLADIDSAGTLKFSNNFGTSATINYEKSGKQVHYLNDNTFVIWENYNENKLKIYTVDENGEKVTD